MRAVSSLLLSILVHALALAYPVSFLKPKPLELIPVTILETASEAPSGTGQADRSFPSAAPAKSVLRKSSSKVQSAEPKMHDDNVPQNKIANPPEPFQSRAATALFAPAERSDNDEIYGSIEDVAPHGSGSGLGQNGEDGNGLGFFSAGQGNGNGFGKGSGRSNLKLTQVGYRETPKPVYPESAREKGREGTVLLRVLVDDQGRAKTIEVNKSSGDDSLDRAAGEAIKRWRFNPAHYGDKAVESWIRIPVDFRLADANSH